MLQNDREELSQRHPTSSGMDRAEIVDDLAHQLQHAGPCQDNIAFRLDSALVVLERNALSKTAQQLDANEYRLLSSALAVASARAYANPPAGLSNNQVVSGLMLVSQILIFWALPDETRAASPTVARHFRDLARVLRNLMHNANLLNGVQDDLTADSLRDAPRFELQGLAVDPTAAMKLFIKAMTAAGYSDAA